MGRFSSSRQAAPARKRFHYEPRRAEDVRARSEQKGGAFDSLFLQEFPVIITKEGDHTYRPMPPTFKDPKHWGIDLWVHYGVGSDRQSYLCLKEMRDEPCPVCEERARAQAAGDAEYAKALAPRKRVLMWAIDRDKEGDGPQLLNLPWTLDRDIAACCIDKRSGEALSIDDPNGGFDVEFRKEGALLKTKYVGVRIARRASPLSEDEGTQQEWLDYIMDHPLPDTLQFFDYEYIQDVFAGGAPPEVAEPEVEETTAGEPLGGRDARGGRRFRDEPAEEAEEEARSSRATRGGESLDGLGDRRDRDGEDHNRQAFDEDRLPEEAEPESEYETTDEDSLPPEEPEQEPEPRSAPRGREAARGREAPQTGRTAARGGRDEPRGGRSSPRPAPTSGRGGKPPARHPGRR